MLKSYWIAALALGLIVFAPLGQAQEQAGKPDREASQQNTPQILPVPVPVQIIEDNKTAQARQRHEAEAAQREKEDLVAQKGMNAATQAMNSATQRMACYALWSTILIGIGTALLVWTLFLTRQANRATVEAVEVTDKIGKRQLRAYVDAVSANIEFREPGPFYEIPAPSEYEIHASGVIKNTGQTPARNLEVWVACACEPQPFRDEWLTEFRPEGRGNLGAGQHGNIEATVGISSAERLAALAGTHTVWFFGGISYYDVFGDPWTTSFRLQWDPKTKKLVHSPQGNEAT